MKDLPSDVHILIIDNLFKTTRATQLHKNQRYRLIVCDNRIIPEDLFPILYSPRLYE